MAVNLDTRLPLMAVGDPLDIAGMLQRAQQTQIQAQQAKQQSEANSIAQKLSELKLDYENRKRKRDADAERYTGEALAGMTAGAPEVARTEYVWQQPQQVIEQHAIPARKPTMDDYQQASIMGMLKAGDYAGAFEAYKAAKSGDNTEKFGLSPVYVRDASGNVRMAQPSSMGGLKVIENYDPVEGVTVVNAGDRSVLLGSRTGGMRGEVAKNIDPTAIFNQGEQTARMREQPMIDIATAAEKSKQSALGTAAASELVERREKVAKAEDAIAELGLLQNALKKLPSPAMLALEKPKAFIGLGNKETQQALGEFKRITGRMLEYVNKLPGAATDADRRMFLASAGIIDDDSAPASQRIAAAQSAAASYQRLIDKYGGKAKPKPGIETNILPAASKYPGKIATDQTTGIRYKSNGSKWMRIP